MADYLAYAEPSDRPAGLDATDQNDVRAARTAHPT
jgi:hypothetical protein